MQLDVRFLQTAATLVIDWDVYDKALYMIIDLLLIYYYFEGRNLAVNP
jgi:hypothetical protein